MCGSLKKYRIHGYLTVNFYGIHRYEQFRNGFCVFEHGGNIIFSGFGDISFDFRKESGNLMALKSHDKAIFVYGEANIGIFFFQFLNAPLEVFSGFGLNDLDSYRTDLGCLWKENIYFFFLGMIDFEWS